MRIKILLCSDRSLWYNSHINEEFNVQYVTKESNQKYYWVRTGGYYNTLNFVKEKDCEELDTKTE